jgi:hypothetical protein
LEKIDDFAQAKGLRFAYAEAKLMAHFDPSLPSVAVDPDEIISFLDRSITTGRLSSRTSKPDDDNQSDDDNRSFVSTRRPSLPPSSPTSDAAR